MQSSTQGRYQGYQGYQGYPFINPIVTDVPSIDAATASRWANLPRRPYGQAAGQGASNQGPSGSGSNSRDTPQAQSPRNEERPKKDIDENPVVYIDLPEAGSEVSQSIESPTREQPEFVQDTIMYDPFENRRIDAAKEDARSEQSSVSGSTYSGGYTPTGTRPNPPTSLNLATPGSSGTQSYASSRPTPVPSFMAKESLVYGGDGADGFPLSPIPISEFPEPPPAYSEAPSPQVHHEPRQEAPPPRTQVIVADLSSPISPVGLPNYDRKNVTCHHCGVRVHTLVIKEVGCMTHIIAFLVFFICLPFVLLVYFTDYFKHKNHYCPNCNQLIGYELPVIGQKLNLVT